MQREDDYAIALDSGELPAPRFSPSAVHPSDHAEKSHAQLPPEEHVDEGEGPWLLSYADMVTLLMCFFILFFQIDKNTGKYNEPQKMLARLKMLVSEAKDASKADNQSLGTDEPSSSVTLDTVFALGHQSPDTVEVVLLTHQMFLPGSATLTPNGQASVEGVARSLNAMPKNSLIEIEGHTDSMPLKNSTYKDNWELSSARASSVLRVLAKQGIPPERMRVTGLAHFHPLVPEKDDRGFPILSNQALNRRIVVRLRTPAKKSNINR